MCAEVLAALRPRANGRYLDGTLGGGGHAAAILAASAPTGRLYGCDRDGDAIETCRRRLAEFAGRFDLRQCTFAQSVDWIEAGSCDGAVLDLGVSSAQLDQAGRGFSFQADSALDMRMDQRQELTAARWLAEAGVEDLAQAFWELGGEREARRLAWWIDQERRLRPIASTRQLAALIEKWKRRPEQRIHPATKVFQALRMKVNDEMGNLSRGLPAVWSRLRAGGRLAVVSFHSAEDRVVKEFARRGARDYALPAGVEVDVPELRQPRSPELRLVTRKPLRPSPAELVANPRSRSAQLRVMEKSHGA